MRQLRVKEYESAKDLDLHERKYVLGHDDDTGELFCHIVKDFDEVALSDHLDEVFGRWEEGAFVFTALIDADKSAFTREGRLLIFKGHLRNSVLAILKAERKLDLEDLDVNLIEEYKSEDPAYNQIVSDKNLKDYIWEGDDFVEYVGGFDYKSLGKYKK